MLNVDGALNVLNIAFLVLNLLLCLGLQVPRHHGNLIGGAVEELSIADHQGDIRKERS